MEYEKIKLFGARPSRGTFDDFFNSEKYTSLKDAYLANDYIECNFVKDENKILYIEAVKVSEPDIKKYHQLLIQNPVAGLDMLDEIAVCNMALDML